MHQGIDRRGFLRTLGMAGAGLGYWAAQGTTTAVAAEAERGAPSAAKLGWQLGCTTYSFNQLSFCETIDKVAELGLNCVEGFSWQPLGAGKPDVKTNHEMSAADRKLLRQRLADKGVQFTGCYYSLPPVQDCRPVFAWAKEMGLQYIVAEPKFADYAGFDKLCQEYQVKLAIHNHAKPNPNWKPEILMEHLKECSPWIGACCDTGHWVRSGLDPVAMLRIVNDRIITFHLKDLPTIGEVKAGCVPFGTGKGDIAGIMAEAKRLGFHGVLSIEYEPYTAKSYDNVAQCVAFFEKTAAALARS